MRVLNLEQGGDHAGLPVVAVENVGPEIKMHQRVDHCPAEEAEALILIPAQAIDVGAAEVELVIHKVEGDALILKRLDAAVLLAPAQLHLKLAFQLHLADILLGNGGIQRQNDAHIRALCLKDGRERAHNIRQAAGFDKRHTFGSGK